jgi:hypothetical protein
MSDGLYSTALGNWGGFSCGYCQSSAGAWHYDIIPWSKTGEKKRLGLWQQYNPQLPWEFRKMQQGVE